MNENLAEVIRRYEQERVHSAPQATYRPRPTGGSPEPVPVGAQHRRCGAKLPAEVRAVNSTLPGAFDAEWMAALTALNGVGLASVGCHAWRRIGKTT